MAAAAAMPQIRASSAAVWASGRAHPGHLAGFRLLHRRCQSQRGIVLQFGSFKETTDPGLRWRLPYPIQSTNWSI